MSSAINICIVHWHSHGGAGPLFWSWYLHKTIEKFGRGVSQHGKVSKWMCQELFVKFCLSSDTLLPENVAVPLILEPVYATGISTTIPETINIICP